MNAASIHCRTLMCAAAAALAAALAGAAAAHGSPPSGRMAHVEVYDRVSGAALAVHEKDGRHYVVGTPGHEYAIRIRNVTGRRILAVTSVDGVNVITGDTASPDQSGYVIDPWGSVEIAGWRKNLSETAAFFFTEHANSYAARTGRPFDVGVIGVAVFAERTPRYSQRFAEPLAQSRREEAKAAAADAAAGVAAPAPPASAPVEARSRDEAVRQSAAPAAKLGTGHGRQETSYARQVAFERASTTPEQMVAINYDRRENLVAMGVLPRQSHLADRTPRPFPGLRFVPDPR